MMLMSFGERMGTAFLWVDGIIYSRRNPKSSAGPSGFSGNVFKEAPEIHNGGEKRFGIMQDRELCQGMKNHQEQILAGERTGCDP